METFTCTQHGCEFEADELPEVCPVCNNPQVENGADADDVELPWSEYTKDELLGQCKAWEIDGYSSRSSMDELIALLEAAEAEDEAEDDDD